MTPDATLVARFRADLDRVLGRAIDAGDTIALAVSGGADSMALLALAVAAFPGQVVAATVDHGLRVDGAAEAAMVAGWCAGAGVPHESLVIAVPPGASGNLQSWARQERYALLRRWCVEAGAGVLATAHHGDDQAETFLMRAARGSGVAGLAAVRACREITFAMPVTGKQTDEDHNFVLNRRTLTLLRPLLGWRRAELRGVAIDAGLPFVDDPSNSDDRFDRARVRRWLESADWIEPLGIARAAAHVAEAEADLMAVSRWMWEMRALPSTPCEARIEVAELPREVRRRLSRIAIEGVRMANGIQRPAFDTAANIEPLLDALDAGTRATQAGVMVTPHGTVWHFAAAPPRRSH